MRKRQPTSLKYRLFPSLSGTTAVKEGNLNRGTHANEQVPLHARFPRREWKIVNFFKFGNDPTAGSPTVTLLRLLLPLDESVRTTLTTHSLVSVKSPTNRHLQSPRRLIQSVVATGGVYKGQGRNLDELDDSPILGIPRSRAIIAIPYPNHVLTRRVSKRFTGFPA